MSDVSPATTSVRDDAAGLLRGPGGLPGLSRLLRFLGFRQPLRRLAAAGLPRSVRVAGVTCRGSVAGFAMLCRGKLDGARVRDLARVLRAGDATRHHVIVAADPAWTRLAVACGAPGLPLRHVVLEPRTLHLADLDLLAEMAPEPSDSPLAAVVRIGRALDRERVGSRFFRDVVAARALVARSWAGVPDAAAADRDALALLLLSRLMFLYFLQHRGLLGGQPDYLASLFRTWRRAPHGRSFFRARLRVLFFGVLNRRPGDRSAAALELGPLPYLNGGLFELHRMEARLPSLDLPDEVVAAVFDGLLERYRFTSAEHGAPDDPGLGIDPEMLGRIFEGLMGEERRGRTGTFYTPSSLVRRVVRESLTRHLAVACDIPAAAAAALLDAPGKGGVPADLRRRAGECLAGLKILDPACGSGAFLLGALGEVAQLRRRLDPGGHAEQEVRQSIVGDTLHGVDLLADAALICCLRLWLGLIPREPGAAGVSPLPNLDRRVRQGDALIDPLDIGETIDGRALDLAALPALRRLTARLQPLGRRYLAAEPEARPALRRALHGLEARLARAWLAALHGRLDREAREFEARSHDRDLFGELLPHATAALRRLRAVRARQEEMHAFRTEVDGRGQLPFFSFRVHFAEAGDGFDLVLCNPPWVRAHHWPPGARALLRERYTVCRNAGWPFAATLVRLPTAAGAQVDLSLLFLERSIRLLREGGTLAMVLPAKLIRSLYAGGARELAVERLRMGSLEDHSLDHRGLFAADAYTSVLIATVAPREGGGRSPPDDVAAAPDGVGAKEDTESIRDLGPVEVTLSRAGAQPLRFHVRPQDLPLRQGDARSPWLLAPPGCAAAMRKMQAAGVALGEELRIRRGVVTGGNDVLVIRDVQPKLGNLARIRTDGHHGAADAAARRRFSGWVEASAIRPALRGSDVSAWRIRCERHLLWAPVNGGELGANAPRLQRFLQRNARTLPHGPAELGRLQRLSADTLGHKVVWSDLARDLRAAAVPARTRCVTGTEQPIVPLNTVYFMATESSADSMLLAAYLNSMPLRVFARAIAERAKDAHFRFFAWVIAVLPLPRMWRSIAPARRLLAVAEAAHGRGHITPAEARELDTLVAASFGLDSDDVAQLAAFDRWLHGTGAGVEAAA